MLIPIFKLPASALKPSLPHKIVSGCKSNCFAIDEGESPGCTLYWIILFNGQSEICVSSCISRAIPLPSGGGREFVSKSGNDGGTVVSIWAVGAAVVPVGFTEITNAAAIDITQPTTKRMFNVRVILFRES